MSSFGERVAKNTFWLWVAECWHGLFFFILTVLLARNLGDSGYGRFSFAINYATLMGIVVDFGLNPLLIREGARKPSTLPQLFQHAFILRILLSVIYIIISVGILVITKPDSEILLLALLLSLWMIFYQGTQLFYAHFRAKEEMRLEGLGRILFSSLTVTFIGIFLLFRLPLVAYAGAYAVSSIITFFVLCMEYLRREHWPAIKIKWKTLRYLIHQSWPFALSSVFISIYYYMDSIYLGFLKQEQALGWYNADYKIILFLLLFTQVIGSVFYPILSRLSEDPNRLLLLPPILNHFVRIQWILSLPIAIGGSYVSHDLLRWIFGPSFANGGTTALQILLFMALIVFLNTIYAQVLQSHNHQKTILFSVGIGALINIILNSLLIPLWSLNGAAIATLLSEFSVFIIIMRKTRLIVHVQIWNYALRTLGATLAMLTLLVFLQGFPLGIKIFSGMIFYCLMLFVFRAINFSDVQFFKSFFFHKSSVRPSEEILP